MHQGHRPKIFEFSAPLCFRGYPWNSIVEEMGGKEGISPLKMMGRASPIFTPLPPPSRNVLCREKEGGEEGYLRPKKIPEVLHIWGES